MISESTVLFEEESEPGSVTGDDPLKKNARTAYWYLLYTKPKKEDMVTQSLRRVNMRVYNPKLKKCKGINGAMREQVFPLFPCYVFAKFGVPHDLRMIRYTRGVRRIVGFDGIPVSVPEELVSVIRSREREGFVEITPAFQDGDRVVIKEGPLKDFIGIFQSDLNDSARVVILLSTLAEKRIVIQRSCIERF